MLWLVLVVTGLVAALPSAFLLHLLVQFMRRLIGPFDGAVNRHALLLTGGIALSVALLDAALIIWNRPRPWSVRSQVPRLWGHESGPWWAAARYGLRLGLGPATILNSWMWWGAMAVTAMQSLGDVVLVTVVFVVIRSIVTFSVSSGVRNGSDMAKRMSAIAGYDSTVRVAVAVIAGAIGFSAMIGASL
jgi:hypothetical protein